MSSQDTVGASKSLNLTMTEIERYLDGEYPAISGPMRTKLNDKLADLAEWWFREGFAVAHQICVKKTDRQESITTIAFRDHAAWLGPNVTRDVQLDAPTADRPDASWDI